MLGGMDTPDPVTRLNAALQGRYRIEREIGEGGMATVYLADDLKHERKVALKVLKPELAAVVGAERFLAEIKTTANLQHPHILPLFDSGEADGFLFYVMPYVEGDFGVTVLSPGWALLRPNAPTHEELTAALVSAGAAHHDYESRFLGGERDERWPGWYAAYVLGRLGDFTTPTTLSSWLESAPSEGEWAPDASSFVLAQIEAS